MKKLIYVLFVSLLVSYGVLAQVSATPATSETSAAATKPKKQIFRANKDQITQVQKMLKEKNLYSGDATGKLDTATRDSIKSFQKPNGLKETGTLNRATLEKMGIELTDKQKLIPVSPNSFAASSDAKPVKLTASTASTSGDAPKKPAPFRANSDQIKSAQKLLKDSKMYAGEESGKFDDAFREGLGKYQEANGLKSTKTLNAATLEKMGIALTDAQKANVAAQAAYDAAKKPY